MASAGCSDGGAGGGDGTENAETGGTAGSDTGGSDGSGGTGGSGGATGGTGGSGGTGDVCDCAADETCVGGACLPWECEPDEDFCSGNAVRRCAANGLSSTEQDACGADAYCDAASATCKDGVCAPDEPTCVGDTVRTCNAEGTGHIEAGSILCESGTSCDAGECKPHICTPGEGSCQGLDVKLCAMNGLGSTVEETCEHLCLESACVPDCGDLTVCGESCIDTQTTLDHCGACGQACSGAHMQASSCDGGTCSGTCAAGYDDCNEDLRSDGCETHIASDLLNCQTCNNPCEVPTEPNMIATCDSAGCGVTCSPGFSDCSGGMADGCETSTATDPSNCGGCGESCGEGERCVSAMCSKVVFTTSATFVGSSIGSTTKADELCQASATAAGLEGDFKAWLSSSDSSAAERLDTSWTGPYARVDGVVVAVGWSGWASETHLASMSQTEFGGFPSTPNTAWTGTLPDGSVSERTCYDWKDTGIQGGTRGRWLETSLAWTADTNVSAYNCGLDAHLYCIQQ